jgi:hypothetical protein
MENNTISWTRFIGYDRVDVALSGDSTPEQRKVAWDYSKKLVEQIIEDQQRLAELYGTKTPQVETQKSEPQPTQNSDVPYCNKHKCFFVKHTKGGKTWYSHVDKGSETGWCNFKEDS